MTQFHFTAWPDHGMCEYGCVCAGIVCVCTTGGMLPVLAKWWVPEVWRVHGSTARKGGSDWFRPP